jgi:hypothetical protein
MADQYDTWLRGLGVPEDLFDRGDSDATTDDVEKQDDSSPRFVPGVVDDSAPKFVPGVNDPGPKFVRGVVDDRVPKFVPGVLDDPFPPDPHNPNDPDLTSDQREEADLNMEV